MIMTKIWNLLKNLKNSLINSVEKRLMAEVPFGVLLSGVSTQVLLLQ